MPQIIYTYIYIYGFFGYFSARAFALNLLILKVNFSLNMIVDYGYIQECNLSRNHIALFQH